MPATIIQESTKAAAKSYVTQDLWMKIPESDHLIEPSLDELALIFTWFDFSISLFLSCLVLCV
jgi:hypothetical protein